MKTQWEELNIPDIQGTILAITDEEGRVFYSAEDIADVMGLTFDTVEEHTPAQLSYMDGVLAMAFDSVYDLCLYNKANDYSELLDILNQYESKGAGYYYGVET